MEKVIKSRESNMDLLRIVCMLLIISYHYMIHGEIVIETLNSNLEQIVILIIKVLSFSATSCFFILTGYYGITSKFNFKKILNLCGKILLYSYIIIFGYYLYNYFNSIEFSYNYKNILVILFGQYWFLTTYIALYIFKPFINKMISALSQTQFKILVALMIGICALDTTIFRIFTVFVYSQVFMGITFYLIGGYIKLYYKANTRVSERTLKYVICLILTVIAYIVFRYIYFHYNANFYVQSLFMNFFTYTNIWFIILPIQLFMIFYNLKIKNVKFSKVISYCAISVVSVYIIHENVLNRDMWNPVFHIQDYLNSNFIYLHWLLIVIGIFIVCIAIDKIRIAIMKIILKNKCIIKINNYINEKCNKINMLLS